MSTASTISAPAPAYPFSSSALLDIDISTFLLLALTSFLLYACASSVYQLYFSPLAAVPGPWYAAISDFWLTTHVARLQQCMTVQALFERYGPVVRVGPNKVVFCDLTTMRAVYCVHKFDKSPFYKALLTYVAVTF